MFWIVHLGLFTDIFVWLLKLLWSDLYPLPTTALSVCFLHLLPGLQGLPSATPAQFKLYLFYEVFPHSICLEEGFCFLQHLMHHSTNSTYYHLAKRVPVSIIVFLHI